MRDAWFQWDGAAVVPERTSAACVLAAADGRAYLAWTGTNYRVNLAWSHDGQAFGGTQTYAHRTSKTTWVDDSTPGSGRSSSTTKTVALAPALAGGPGGLHMAWTGTNARVNVWRLADGDGGHVVLQHRSLAAPTLGACSSGTVLAWAGTDTQVNLLYPGGGPHVVLHERTRGTPAACGAGREVVVVWVGTDRHINVLRSEGRAFGDGLRLEETSDSGVAACPAGDGVLVAWTGADRRINLVPVGPWGLGRSARLDAARTMGAPALCSFGPGVLLGWTGSDGRPNVARLRLFV